MKKRLSQVLMASVLFLLGTSAMAACNVNIPNLDNQQKDYLNSFVQNSEVRFLRDAHDHGECIITQNFHKGGVLPGWIFNEYGNPNDAFDLETHITVSLRNHINARCHVFQTLNSNGQRYLTTCGN